MYQIFYFLNIKYLPSKLLELPVNYQDFLSPAFIDPREAQGLKNNLIRTIIQEMRSINKKRLLEKQRPFFSEISRDSLDEWIELDQRFMAMFNFEDGEKNEED